MTLSHWLTTVLALASCASERPPAKIETPEGVIYARNEEVAQECSSKVREYRPFVTSVLGDRSGPIEIQLRPWFAGCTFEETGQVIVHENSQWHLTLAHELGHLHAAGAWETLPESIAEALCDFIAHRLIGDPICESKPPTLEDAKLALTLKDWPKNASVRVLSAAYWILGQVGLEPLRQLALHAEHEGRKTIPQEWFLELLPKTAWEPKEIDMKSFFERE